MRAPYLLPILLLLGACSSVPEPIRRAPTAPPPLGHLIEQTDEYQGQTLRLGGEIAKVINTADETLVEIVARRLFRSGEPRQEDASEGRFIAIVPNFLDPTIHAPGRRMTVTGQFTGVTERSLGEMDYPYPQIEVQAYYLWPEWREDPRLDPVYGYPWYPFGYPYWPTRDPFWSPFWHPYPW